MKRYFYLISLITTICQAQYTQLGNKLIGTGSIGAAWQGMSVGLSADGKTAIVGAYKDNSGIGAAWIYTFNGSGFIQTGNKLVGTNSIGTSGQGWSVDISADGKRAVVGGLYDNATGATWVYTFNGSNFVQAGNKLVGSGATTNGGQGTSVAISGDGNTIVVGGGYNDGIVGATWIFTFNGSNFVQVGSRLSGSDHVGNANQGMSVDISYDGKTVVSGGRWDNTNVGAGWIYTFNGTGFVQAGNKLVGTGSIGESWQGNSVCISGDGKTVVIGGTDDDSNTGAVWVYTFNGSNYVQAGTKLKGTNEVGAAGFGYCGISGDGSKIVVGGSADNAGTGAVWVYTFNGTGYVPSGNKLIGTGSTGTASLGYLTQISADGNTIISGGIYDNSNQGAAWVFVNTSTSCNVDLTTGLIAYYPFNGNANDETGNGNNGTIIGASLSTDKSSAPNSAYYFNGVDNYINVGTTLGNFGLSDFTISVWMKTDNPTDIGSLVSKRNWGSTSNFFDFELGYGANNGLLSADINQDATTSLYRAIWSNKLVNDGLWHHCVFMRKNGKIVFYIDGQSDYRDVTTGTGIVNLNNPSAKTTIGCSGTFFDETLHFFKGTIDEVRMYNRALSDCELMSLYATTTESTSSGLMVSYPFNGNANDVSGNGYNGTVSGATLTEDRFENLNSAYYFDGSSYISTLYNGIPGKQGRTVSLWAKLYKDYSNYAYLVFYGKLPNDYGESFRSIVNWTLYEPGIDVGSGAIGYQKNLNDEKWHHLVWVLPDNLSAPTANDIKIYCDGVLLTIQSNPFQSNIAINTVLQNPLSIGAYKTESIVDGYFKGSLDDIQIYDRALSNLEIQTLYNEFPAFNSKPIASYPFCGNANDASGNGNHGTVSGASLTTDRFGNTNSAYYFDGSGANIEVANSASLQSYTTALGFSFWTKWDPITNSDANFGSNVFNKTLEGLGDGILVDILNGSHPVVGTYTNALRFTFSTDNNTAAFDIRPYNDDVAVNQWQHNFVQFGNSEVRFYINGALSYSTTVSGTVLDNNSLNLLIGSNSLGNRNYKGALDDIYIYNRVISDAEILALYNDTSTNVLKPIIGRNNNNLIVNNKIEGVNYQWLFDGTNEAGQSSFVHTSKLQQGAYQVMATSDLTACASKLSDIKNVIPIVQVVTVTNIELKCVTQTDDLRMPSIEIYPNPGPGLFNIRVANVVIERIEIFNAQGQIVYNKPFEKSIDLSGQPAGIYLLRIHDQSETLLKTLRIIIE